MQEHERISFTSQMSINELLKDNHEHTLSNMTRVNTNTVKTLVINNTYSTKPFSEVLLQIKLQI